MSVKEWRAAVDDFIEENRELVEDPDTSLDELWDIRERAHSLRAELAEEVVILLSDAWKVFDALEVAKRDSSLSPEELQERKLDYKTCKVKLDAANDPHDRIAAFANDVWRKHFTRLTNDRLATLAEREGASRHSFWQKLFR